MEEAYNYYTSEQFLENIEMPRNPSFRHYRGKNAKGRWRKIPVRISTSEDLQRWVVKLGLIDVYYGTSCWLNPHKTSSKLGPIGGYQVADNMIIDAKSLVFDIDAKGVVTRESLNQARKSTWNIYQAMKNLEGYEYEYCAFTGSKGFRLSYIDNTIVLPEDPRKRYDYIENYRKVFIVKLLKTIEENAHKQGYYKIKTFFDEKITYNPMYVVRVLGTTHSGTGYLTTRINPLTLKKDIKVILEGQPSVGQERPGILDNKEMTPAEVKSNSPPRPRLIQQGGDVTGNASSPFYYFFTNRVLGVRKAYIPVFMYDEKSKYWKKDVLEQQKSFRLGNIITFKKEKSIICISTKVMQRRQLAKVLNKSMSRTKHTFRKYNKIHVPLDMEYEETIKGPYTGTLSRAHTKMLTPKKNTNNNQYSGWDKIEIVRAEKE